MVRCGSRRARQQHTQSSPREKKPRVVAPKRRRFQAETSLLAAVEADQEACSLLATATTPSTRAAFYKYVLDEIGLPKDLPRPSGPGAFLDDFTSWAGQLGTIRNISVKNLPAALAYRLQEKDLLRWSKKHFIETAQLNWRAVDKAKFLSKFNVHKVAPLPRNKIYPPVDQYIAETQEIYNKNHQFICVDNLHDSRDHRRDIHMLKESKLQKDIPFDQSAIFYDKATNRFIGMVIRDVCKNEDAVEFVDGAIEHVIDTRKTCRVSLPPFTLLKGNLGLPERRRWFPSPDGVVGWVPKGSVPRLG